MCLVRFRPAASAFVATVALAVGMLTPVAAQAVPATTLTIVPQEWNVVGASRAVVEVTPGGVAKETLLRITNMLKNPDPTPVGSIKVCNVAGNGVKRGTPFTFRVGRKSITVPAGPASSGGYCKIAGRFARGSKVTVTERATSSTRVTAITLAPADRKVSSSLA